MVLNPLVISASTYLILYCAHFNLNSSKYVFLALSQKKLALNFRVFCHKYVKFLKFFPNFARFLAPNLKFLAPKVKFFRKNLLATLAIFQFLFRFEREVANGRKLSKKSAER